ncbi:MAG: hypothetical protein R3277_06605 [Brumimicrobium sp.]|nr:hypothetical protein [Brumimicrobium sp.]
MKIYLYLTIPALLLCGLMASGLKSDPSVFKREFSDISSYHNYSLEGDTIKRKSKDSLSIENHNTKILEEETLDPVNSGFQMYISNGDTVYFKKSPQMHIIINQK